MHLLTFDLVTLCATPEEALDAWDADPRCIIVTDGTGYAVAHEQPAAFFYPGWHAIAPETLEDAL